MKDFEQFLFPFVQPGVKQPCSPPETRDECDHIQRPCNRTKCRHNLTVETEVAGKPHNGRHPDQRLRVLADGAESCALDVAGRGEHSNAQVGAILGVTGNRIRQIAIRGGLKLLISSIAEDGFDAMRTELARHGVTLDVTWADTNDTGAATAVVVLNVPKMGPAPVQIRKKER